MLNKKKSRLLSGKKTLLLLFIAFASNCFSQKPNDPKHENHYRVIPTINTDELSIDFADQHSQMEFTKMKIKITNKTDDFIVFKMGENDFIYEHSTFNPKEKMVIIDPKESISKTLSVNGDTRFHVEKFELKLKGFYRAPLNGDVHNAENFKLPPESNGFSAGPFKVTHKSKALKKESRITNAKFKCTYSGQHIGLVNPYKLKVKLEDGQQFPNMNDNIKTKLLLPGKSYGFNTVFKISTKIIDMQFANMEINWNDMFVESKLSKLEDISVSFELDPGKTAGKNK
ncbi:MAG: hypothetical protein COA57_08140 [Flavobacteriales bacterium]|nr:hypothetical protein [Bacteroidales bacterium AH-315-I05]PCJ85173.1 MAG: hypothetical protein COA57_08140 [Flavobacteriales bacterium]